MISNKTLATLFFIPLNMQRAAASSSSGTQIPSPSDKPTLKKRQGPALKTEVLQDTTSTVSPVEVQEGSTEVMSTSQELSVPQVNNPFKILIRQGEYKKIFKLGERMNDEEFLKQLCPIIETSDQYNKIVDYLESRKMVALFYTHGDIEVVRRAIVESNVYVMNYYLAGNDLETALPLALENDNHDRFIELLDIRKGIAAKNDELVKQQGRGISFGWFVYWFLDTLAPWKDGMAFRRFLILRGDELRSKYHGILDTLCQKLVYHLKDWLRLPKAECLLVDLIGQPSLLTPVVFVKGFLDKDFDVHRSNFIKHGWRDAIQEGLKSEYPNGGEKLWRVMQAERPKQFLGEFPVTEKARAAVCMHFSTKQQKEDEWADKNDKIFYYKLNYHKSISRLLPDVLWPIILEYVIPRPAADDSTPSTKRILYPS